MFPNESWPRLPTLFKCESGQDYKLNSSYQTRTQNAAETEHSENQLYAGLSLEFLPFSKAPCSQRLFSLRESRIFQDRPPCSCPSCSWIRNYCYTLRYKQAFLKGNHPHPKSFRYCYSSFHKSPDKHPECNYHDCGSGCRRFSKSYRC